MPDSAPNPTLPERIREIHEWLTGNGDPEKGIFSRLTRLEIQFTVECRSLKNQMKLLISLVLLMFAALVAAYIKEQITPCGANSGSSSSTTASSSSPSSSASPSSGSALAIPPPSLPSAVSR